MGCKSLISKVGELSTNKYFFFISLLKILNPCNILLVYRQIFEERNVLLLHKNEIIRKISEEYPKTDENLSAIILFGSVARGDFSPMSDIDLLLVTSNIEKTRYRFSEFKYAIYLDTSVVISAKYITPNDLEHVKEPFFDNIIKEGKKLWKRK
ncbi:MAG: nucleotidyltransferase domain-containing protein [Candidatus Helarchaeota archaeon]